MLADTYRYELPPPPSDEKEILNYDKKKKDQFWERPHTPDLNRMGLTERIRYIEEERRRLVEGVFMMNNGELVWLSPVHYDFLRYANIPDFNGAPRYYDAHRKDCYFHDFYTKDPNCFGELTIKARRYGYTALAIMRCINAAITGFGRNIGMASTNLEKVKETIFRPLIDSYLTRPKYVRPDIYMPNRRIPQKELRFKSATADELNEYDLDLGGSLNSWISPRPTTAKTFDGYKWFLVIMDEIFKWTDASVYNTWKITKETLAVGGEILGKAAVFASMGDDDTCDDAVKDGIKLWGESNYNERNKNGQTVSGLYRYFIPAYVAYAKFIDKYGKCDERLAREYLEEERAGIAAMNGEDSKEYLYHVRRFPFTAEEAMASAENVSTFSAIRLNKRLTKMHLMPAIQRPYTVGNFKWDDFHDRSVFEPTTKGYWKMAYQVPPEARNRCRRVRGRLVLPRNQEGVIGNDPVSTRDNVSGHLSKNAAYVYQKFDYFNSRNANKLLAQLYGREEDVDIFNEQLRLASLYFGYPVMTERQITSTYDHFRTHKMQDFLLKSEYDGATGLWMSSKVIGDGLDLIQAYIKRPMVEGDEDLLELIQFEELIEQLKDFDKSKSTKFDAVMALIITLIGARQIEYSLLTDEDQRARSKMLSALFPSR